MVSFYTVAHRGHGTNKNLTAQTKTPRHKQKLHGSNKNSTAQTKTPRHKQKLHGTNKILPRHKQNIATAQTKYCYGTNKILPRHKK
jgi:ribosomal protein L36